ncbi:MAG: translation elongation factor Ts [Eubacteriales bacterium]
MAEITAKAVQELRSKTGAGMMECKRALTETGGDFEEAVKVLREKGLAVAAKKADRIAAEGLVDIIYDADTKTAVMIEVNSETDFVAKNADFQEFVKGCLRTVLKNKPADVAQLLTLKYDDTDMTVDGMLKEKILTIGENLSIRRFLIVEGDIATYIHGKGSMGVIVKCDADASVVSSELFSECAKNVALQIAAMTPSYLNSAAVPASVIAGEKEILFAQIKNDPSNAKKPDNIIEKMIEGRINKFYETSCLLNQVYVKDDSLTVGKYVESVAKQLGGKLEVTAFYSFEKGEGLQKREDNFAEEIAQLTGQK